MIQAERQSIQFLSQLNYQVLWALGKTQVRCQWGGIAGLLFSPSAAWSSGFTAPSAQDSGANMAPPVLLERPWKMNQLDSCLNMSLEKIKIEYTTHDSISFVETFFSVCISFSSLSNSGWEVYKSCLNCFTTGSLSDNLIFVPILVPNSIGNVLYQG